MSPFETTEASLRRSPESGALRLVGAKGQPRGAGLGLVVKIVLAGLLFAPIAFGAFALADGAAVAMGGARFDRSSVVRDFIDNVRAREFK